jgi:putative zinc finger protein
VTADALCHESLRRLDDYLDRNLAPDEVQLVQAHLRECLRCARQFRFEASVLDGIRLRLRHLSVPSGLLQAIQLRLRAASIRPVGGVRYRPEPLRGEGH